MWFKLWDILTDVFKGKWYWHLLQPLLVLIIVLVIAEVAAYQFVQWQYGLTPSLSLFLQGYLFRQVLIVFAAITGVIVATSVSFPKRSDWLLFREAGRAQRRQIIARSITAAAVVLLALLFFRRFSPTTKVSHIRITFLDDPNPATDFDRTAFAYLVYELNSRQRSWYFEIDSVVFRPTALDPDDQRRCLDSRLKSLCRLNAYARQNNQPCIGITTRRLEGDAIFWIHSGNASIISTADMGHYKPLSHYEYLLHCLIAQSVALHLEAQHGALPEHAFDSKLVSHGGFFESSPQSTDYKAAILAAHFSPDEEVLLFNSFGADYLHSCSQLLTLEWLRSKQVADNLKRLGVNETVSSPVTPVTIPP